MRQAADGGRVLGGHAPIGSDKLAAVALPPPTPSSTCLVTGASSGIGADIARELARRGHGVTLVARREDRLAELAETLQREHGVRTETIGCDVGDTAAREQMIAELDRRELTVDVLVNNAGYGSGGRFQDLDPASEVEMVRVNVDAPHALCAVYVPRMIERGRGAILNVASVVAFQPLPRQATYCATKAFVLSFTEALHADLHGTGVTATALCPGATKTEFFQTGGMGKDEQGIPSFALMDSAEVARTGVEAMVKGQRSVVPGLFNTVTAVSGRMTPRNVLLPLLRRVYPVGK